ncbi:Glucose-6-phosphate 1-dehydrogenase, cytoplasmic isoform [Platanthera guangdongensis]|uniref:glucose-6-phosphate dehydrogenase (NADP(+)) n=1 Tax=Platanthera guangdongensis TaxID=2320717 RepID=A0ABR2LKI2_9ASPA
MSRSRLRDQTRIPWTGARGKAAVVNPSSLRYLCKGNEDSTEESDYLSKFLQLIKYVSGSYDSEEGFLLLNKEISEHETSKNSQPGTSRRLFYLALPPSVYRSVCRMIRSYCMNQCKVYYSALSHDNV